MPAPISCRRLAILGAWAPHRDEDAFARAARRLGVDTRVYDVLHWTQRAGRLASIAIERAVQRFEPDFILCTRDAYRLGAERLRRLFKHREVAFWYVDPDVHPGVLELARICGTMYVTYAARRDYYRSEGIDIVRFLPQAVDRDRDIPATTFPERYRCDASFVGSGPYPHRWPVLAAVGDVCRLQVRGPGWQSAHAPFPIAGGPVHGSEFAAVIAGAAVSLGANSVPSIASGYASASNRMWKIFGCGGAYVGEYVDGIEQFARPGEHCLWFRTPAECADQALSLMADPDQRRAMAQRAREHTLAHHTYEHRMHLLLTGTEYPLE